MFIVDYVSTAVANNDPPVQYGIWEDQLAGMLQKLAIFDDTAVTSPSTKTSEGVAGRPPRKKIKVIPALFNKVSLINIKSVLDFI